MMNNPENIILSISFIVILLFCLTPVLLFRKSIKETFFVGIAIIVFTFFYKDLFSGIKSSYHDTFWGFEFYLRLVRQWVSCGFYPGWNPYMNGGEPVYLFSNSFFQAPFLFFCLLAQVAKISNNLLFNHCWIFMFLNFCIGSFLLFSVLFGDFKVTFFCFISLLLSGFFDVNLGQPAGIVILYFFPYILFGLVLSLERESPYGLALSIIYGGFALNRYNPMYILLIISFFVLILSIFKPSYIKLMYRIIRQHYKLILFSVSLAVLAAAPAFFLRYEIKDFVSPTRGALIHGGAITVEQVGNQPRVAAYLSGYKMLLERILIGQYGGIHHAFYFGIIPLILIPIALFRSKDRFAWIFFITAVFAAILGTGERFILVLLYRFIPGFSMVRHTAWFAPFVSFLLICTSGFGLKVLLSGKAEDNIKNIFVSIVTCVGLILATKDKISITLIFECLLAILASRFLLKVFRDRAKALQLVYLWIFSVLILDLCVFNSKYLTYIYSDFSSIQYYHNGCFPGEEIGDPLPVIYPSERSFYAEKSSPIPIDFSPVFFKEASVTSIREDLMLYRSIRLNDMLQQFRPGSGYEPAFGVDSPIIYFTNGVKIFASSITKEIIFDEIFRYSSERKYIVFFQEDEIDFSIPHKESEDIFSFPVKDIQEKDNPNRISILIDAPVDGFLVRLENFHRGWRATIDNIPTKIYRANYAFQAIQIPKGTHKVIFEFKTIYPILFWIHILISALLWLFLNCYLYKFKS